MRVRENSESIAFYGGETLELKEIGRRLTVGVCFVCVCVCKDGWSRWCIPGPDSPTA